MFPKRGSRFPGTEHDQVYAAAIAEALRRELSNTHQAIKTVVRWTGASERTAKNWLSGARGPNGPHLVTLARHSDEVFEALLVLVGRRQVLKSTRMVVARDRLRELLDLIYSLTTEDA
jgi:hypothetical protein